MGRIISILIIAAIVVFAIVWLLGLNEPQPVPPEPNNGTTATTTPTPSAEISYINADANIVQIVSPLPGAIVPGTFTLTGEARGQWYFEASFPVEVVDPSGARLMQAPVQAQGEWMTTEFVPFSTQITVPNYTGPATLIVHRDNPSGLPENDASVSIPIVIR